MKYEAIARKYRPMNFAEVVGQDHIVSTISNAISSGRIHHAYLFSGTRGVGKTTMARILAKALDCEKGPTSEICGVCDACKGIATGNFVDVQEIDGASNRGIDEIRSLRENVRFAPVSGRYKIFIIDEAHQITGAAFNALLKTLEEPPPHAVFILATTESRSIPATISSRCQKYRFKMISVEEIAAALTKILSAESVTFEPAALLAIARAADGSMRDAQSLLDQAIAYGDRNVTVSSVRELLGVLPSEIIDEALEAVAAGDARAALGCAEKLASGGHDYSAFLTEMLSALRSMLLLAVGAEEVSTEARSTAEKLASKHAPSFRTEKILRFSKLLLKAKEEMRWTHDARFLTELYLVKLTQPFVGTSEILDAVSAETPSAPYVSADGDKLSGPTPSDDKISKSSDFRPAAGAAAVAPVSAAPVEVKPASGSGLPDIWRRLRESLPASEERLRACLANVRLTAIAEGAAELSAVSDFYASAVSKKNDLIAAILEKITGAKLIIKTKVVAAAAGFGGTLSTSSDDDSSDSDDEAKSDTVAPPDDEDESAGFSGSIFAAPEPRAPTASKAPPARSSPDGIKKILDIFPGKVAKAAQTE